MNSSIHPGLNEMLTSTALSQQRYDINNDAALLCAPHQDVDRA